MPIDTIIFDLGGVLIDWDPRYLYKKIFSAEEEMEWFLNHVCHQGWNEQQDAGRLFEDAIEERIAVFPQFKDEIEAYYSRWDEMLGGEIGENTILLKKVHAIKEIGLYALTNWSHQTFPIALERFDFLQLFKEILVSGNEKMKKPEQQIYELMITRFKIHPQNALFIDDSLPNIEAADAIGFKTIHLQQDVSLAEEIESIIGRSL